MRPAIRLRPRSSTWWLVGGLLAAAVALGAVALRGPAPAQSRADQVHAIAVGLRCPVCRDLSVADSPAPLAKQMRDTIAERLAQGRTPDQIRADFVASYGESILLTPPSRGIGLVPWIAPAVLLLAGLGVALLAVRRWRGPPVAGEAGAAGAVEARAAGGAGAVDHAGEAGPAGGEPERKPARLAGADRRMLERALARLDEEERS
jgi:cytochrome c-type biogenesis protein CcmH/NrfF